MESSTIKFAKDSFIGRLDGVFLDNYEVLKQLGKGGYGKVYQVKNIKTGKMSACKHLSKLRIRNLERFKREIEILKKADHPNIIKLYDLFESEHSFYLIMEECKGGEVFDKIIEHIQSKKMFTEKNAAQMIQQVLSAVEYCHQNGIAHRDLKPENLLYLNEGAEIDNPIKVIDFGLSQLIKPDTKLKTKVGTAYYVAPEILQGSYTEKCDIWSMGVILYIFLSGDPPFNGQSDSEIYKKILKLDLSFPERKWKNISNDAIGLIKHMITPENERYNARQVLDHQWFKIVDNLDLCSLNFEPSFLIEYAKSTLLKKIALVYIASRLDENEITDLKKTFDAFNTQKDGQISYNELKEGLSKLNSCHIVEEEIKSLFDNIDMDKNGKIDYTEFIAASMQKKQYLNQEKLYEAFCKLDINKSGKINKEELMKILQLEPKQEKEAEQCIRQADKDGDGGINYKEFLELMGYDDQ